MRYSGNAVIMPTPIQSTSRSVKPSTVEAGQMLYPKYPEGKEKAVGVR